MTFSMSSRDRRTLVVGSAVLLGIVVIGKGLPMAKDALDARRTAATDVLNRVAYARSGASRLTMLRDSLDWRRKERAALDSVLLAGATVPEAGAALASLVSDYADQNAVRVVAVQIRPDTALGATPLVRVAVRLTGVGDVHGLTGLLQDVESGTVTLSVRELGVTQTEAAAPETKAEALHFDILIEGLASISRGGT